MSEDDHHRRTIDRELEPLKEDVKEIKDSVHLIEQEKQDRVKPAVLVTIVFYLISQLLVGVWWASETSARLNQVLAKIEQTGKDRFYGRDGDALKNTMQLNDNLLKREIEFLNDKIEAHDSDAKKYKVIIDKLEISHVTLLEKMIRIQEHTKDPVHRVTTP